MDYLTENVAVNLKRIRQSKGMSLDQVSEQTGVSKSMLSQIEKGTANPSLGVLGKITSGLRIEFQELIATPLVDSYLVTPENLVPTKELEGQYTVWTCFPYEDTRLVEIYRIDIEPGGTYVSGGHGEKTREYLVVTDGVMTVECNGKEHEIHLKQAFRFETDQTHIYRNRGTEKTSCMCFFLDYHKKTTPVIKTVFNSIYGCNAYLIPNIFEFIHHMFMILKYFNLVEELCEPIRSLKSIQN